MFYSMSLKRRPTIPEIGGKWTFGDDVTKAQIHTLEKECCKHYLWIKKFLIQTLSQSLQIEGLKIHYFLHTNLLNVDRKFAYICHHCAEKTWNRLKWPTFSLQTLEVFGLSFADLHKISKSGKPASLLFSIQTTCDLKNEKENKSEDCTAVNELITILKVIYVIITEIEQHFRDTAHPNASDTDEMNGAER